ncbi:MAG TPA: hypothetical protein VGJ00_00085 [Rhabdochlamydiaceae bacterium]|jgi:hypothetical protein
MVAQPIERPDFEHKPQHIKEDAGNIKDAAHKKHAAPKEMHKTLLDPAGVWAAFLSKGGVQATPDEVKMFLQSFEKMFQVWMQQQKRAFERAKQRAREAIEGE